MGKTVVPEDFQRTGHGEVARGLREQRRIILDMSPLISIVLDVGRACQGVIDQLSQVGAFASLE